MRTFSIYTLGCKVNQYESQQIAQLLEELGLSAALSGEKPDLAVINTCCVTGTASAKSRQYIQRALKANPAGVRVVCGCLPAMKSRENPPCDGDNVHIISSRDNLAKRIAQIIIGGNPLIKAKNGSKIKDGMAKFAKYPKLPRLTSFKGHTRAFLKVQDGCDGLCTYCIVPKVRPDVQSKSIEEAVAEARALVAAGHKEIVVTGVCLGAYGRQTVRRKGEEESRRSENLELRIENEECGNNEKLTDLLTALARMEGPFDSAQGRLPRIRVSSLEPGDISEELLDVFCGHPNIMPHIHLSVQSGASATLKRMCRQYTAEELQAKIELIKRRLDRPAITADIIVGFPGETDEDFEQTVELAKWAGFSKIHTFPFSSRMGTPASRMKNKVESKIIKQRAHILRKVSDELGRKFVEQFVGETCEVLLEDAEPLSGRSERYFMVFLTTRTQRHEENQNSLVPSSLSGKGEIVKVRITEATSEGATGEEVKS